DAIFSKIVEALKREGISRINGPVTSYNNYFESVYIPSGWIWEDIGNYYGAGAGNINWKENQFDLLLKPGKNIGDSVIIVTESNAAYRYINELKTAGKNSGDNAYIYFNPSVAMVTVRGTVPCCVEFFKISGSEPNPASNVVEELRQHLNKENISTLNMSMTSFTKDKAGRKSKFKYTHYSPSLDSIIYWFNKKSINLYGEALIKTFAYEKNGFGSTDSGVVIVKNFWKEKGLDKNELNIVDGSGLSPLNRVTTHSQVEILKYARTKDWFSYFKNSLPEYNGMSMKSGTIRGVKGFCGYHKAKNGKEYIFSFLVNNYNGSASALVNKMYKVLDNLK
ncbi:MAG TPA: D-alanyl-D-alanine carboxypeptidase/D-alanyl-D-alanine-endopeptidase, partial [Chitinophagaceae bacterium]